MLQEYVYERQLSILHMKRSQARVQALLIENEQGFHAKKVSSRHGDSSIEIA